MKSIKKMFAFMLSAAMVLMMSIPAFAAGTGSITINNATEGNTYNVYKVFDADGNGTSISYKLVTGKTTAPAGFAVDSAGNVTYTGSGTDGALTSADIAAIAAYVQSDTAVATGKVAAGKTSVTIPNLPNGYYYITTTTGTAVTITSTNPDATVNDKNEAPDLDKKITGVADGNLDADGKAALAQVGTTVSYKATIDVKNGAEGYVFHDVMGTGLSYKNDVKVFVGENEIAAAGAYSTTTAAGDTITVTFEDEWIATQVNNTISITYSATVTSDALTVDTGKNTASIDYGDDNSIDLTEDPIVYNASFTVTKTDGSNQPLAGAGFVIKNANGLYYKLENNVVSWVNDIDEATELTTTTVAGGNVVKFTGLANGTYTLEEKTTPAGYNTAADSKFTIKAGDYTSTNLAQSTTVVNQSGSTLPSTGGTGTTVLYTIGIVLVLGAGILLVVRRRMSVER